MQKDMEQGHSPDESDKPKVTGFQESMGKKEQGVKAIELELQADRVRQESEIKELEAALAALKNIEDLKQQLGDEFVTQERIDYATRDLQEEKDWNERQLRSNETLLEIVGSGDTGRIIETWRGGIDHDIAQYDDPNIGFYDYEINLTQRRIGQLAHLDPGKAAEYSTKLADIRKAVDNPTADSGSESVTNRPSRRSVALRSGGDPTLGHVRSGGVRLPFR